MPIPNVSTLSQRINKGSEGGNEFARVMNLLLTAEYKECSIDFVTFSDSQGDYKGVDSYTHKWEKHCVGFQYKFYPCPLSSKHKSVIKKSLEGAIEKFTKLKIWVLITPDDLMRSDLEWFEKLKDKYEFSSTMVESFKLSTEGKRSSFRISHWGHTKIMELFLNHPHIGNKYYPELFSNTSRLDLVKIGVDSKRCNWSRMEGHKHAFWQFNIAYPEEVQTSDVVFDCQFINNTEKTYLLYSVDVKVIKTWHDIRGLPADRLLKSLGIIEIEVDFNKEITTYEFEDPIIFRPKAPERFGIQLVNFNDRCPDNSCKMLIRFNFNNHTTETNEITLILF